MTHRVRSTLPLASGAEIPSIGLGFWKVPNAEAASVVEQALQMGYRHLDCACDYGNEAEVGIGIQSALKNGTCSRDELWVTSKLWNTYHAAEHVRPALERTLQDLRLDYLDLYLIHFPIAQRFVPPEKRYPPGWFFDPDVPSPRMESARVPLIETWQAMESLVDEGLVRNIGVCNYGCSLIRDLLNSCTIRPAVLQVEMHPYLTQEKLLRFCEQEQIAVTAFSPLGAASYLAIHMAEAHEAVLERPEIIALAARHRKTPAQVVLRWALQRGTAIVPKAANPEHLRENLALFDFALIDAEMQEISAMNTNRRFNDPGAFCETGFNTFYPIYE